MGAWLWLLLLIADARADILLLREDCPAGTRNHPRHGSSPCLVVSPCDAPDECDATLTCKFRRYCVETRTRHVRGHMRTAPDGSLVWEEAHEVAEEVVWSACRSDADCDQGLCQARGSCEKGTRPPPSEPAAAWPDPHALPKAAPDTDADSDVPAEPTTATSAHAPPPRELVVDEVDHVSLVAVGALVSGASMLVFAAIAGSPRQS
jgi:hypothetical protein